jgi:hypothetical protein
MDVYRVGRICCVCGTPIMFMQRRFEYGGVTAHAVCAEYVEGAARTDDARRLSVAAFKDKMRKETQVIEK